jgi:hypothetical protein
MLRPGPTSIFDPKVRRCSLRRHDWANFCPKDANCSLFSLKGGVLAPRNDVQRIVVLGRLAQLRPSGETHISCLLEFAGKLAASHLGTLSSFLILPRSEMFWNCSTQRSSFTSWSLSGWKKWQPLASAPACIAFFAKGAADAHFAVVADWKSCAV